MPCTDPPILKTGSTEDVDRLRIAMSGLPPQLDPQTDTFIVMVRVYPLIFDTLIRRDWVNDGELVPGLALTWEQVDETTLELTLREGVTFQDGSPFTANDVKFTFDRTIDGDARLAANGRYGLTSVEVVDDLTVRLITDGPRGNLLLLLTDPGAEIVPQAYFESVGYEAFQQLPVGTGPYRPTEFTPDTILSMTAYADHWSGAPAVTNVDVVPIRRSPPGSRLSRTARSTWRWISHPTRSRPWRRTASWRSARSRRSSSTSCRSLGPTPRWTTSRSARR